MAYAHRQQVSQQWGDGPRVTPLVEGNSVYAISAHAKLYACDVKSGAVKWQHDLAKELNDAVPDLGYSNSPIIDGELLLVTGLGGANRSLIAFDKNTGRRVWSSHQDHPGYSSPIIISADGVRQAVFFTGTKIVATPFRFFRLLRWFSLRRRPRDSEWQALFAQ
jgi:glucose dehydrogenase